MPLKKVDLFGNSAGDARERLRNKNHSILMFFTALKKLRFDSTAQWRILLTLSRRDSSSNLPPISGFSPENQAMNAVLISLVMGSLLADLQPYFVSGEDEIRAPQNLVSLNYDPVAVLYQDVLVPEGGIRWGSEASHYQCSYRLAVLWSPRDPAKVPPILPNIRLWPDGRLVDHLPKIATNVTVREKKETTISYRWVSWKNRVLDIEPDKDIKEIAIHGDRSPIYFRTLKRTINQRSNEPINILGMSPLQRNILLVLDRYDNGDSFDFDPLNWSQYANLCSQSLQVPRCLLTVDIEQVDVQSIEPID